MNAFESLKKKGKIDNSSLQRLGFEIPITEEVNEENNEVTTKNMADTKKK
jgi:hypothetical protein